MYRTITGILFIDQIFSILGATGEAFILGAQYTQIVLLIAPIWLMVFLTSAFFQAQGDSKTPMIIQLISVTLNIILDPIFIYALNMGVAGAAIATAISITTSFFIGTYFLFTRSKLKIHKNNFHYKKQIVKEILKVGIPASLTMLVISITFMFFNRFMPAPRAFCRL